MNKSTAREHSPKGGTNLVTAELLFGYFGFEQTSKTVGK